MLRIATLSVTLQTNSLATEEKLNQLEIVTKAA